MRTRPWAPVRFQRCNYGLGVKYLSTVDFEIKNIALDEGISSTSLYTHLIRDHSFFGGPGTAYRIDPSKAIRILQLNTFKAVT